jgi:SpoVK/Ycf46/Vps4 family AAA+-type ATPase
MADNASLQHLTSVSKTRNQNSLSETTVLNFDTHIEFPTAKAYPQVPSGIYYPNVDRASGRFILMKVNPNLKKRQRIDLTNDEFMNELRSLIEDEDIDVNPKDYSVDVDGQDNDFLDNGYFNMENFHRGLAEVETSINRFLNNAEFYRSQNLGYKRSALLFGEPGTGKSRYIDNLSRKLINKHDAIVFRIESSSELDVLLEKGLVLINRVMRGRLKVFIIEELATLVGRGNHTEILNLLDNTMLSEDVIFLMTTNTPEMIPANIVDRPSRVDILIEVNSTGLKKGFIESWYEHLIGEQMPEAWKELPFYYANLSPAYLKELFISMKINGVDVDQSWSAIQSRRRLIGNQFRQVEAMGFR